MPGTTLSETGVSDPFSWAGRALVVRVNRPIPAEHVPALTYAAARHLSIGRPERVEVRLTGLGEPDLTTVDILARLQLAAKRSGIPLRMVDASRRLLGLLALVGLDEALRPCDRSGNPARLTRPG